MLQATVVGLEKMLHTENRWRTENTQRTEYKQIRETNYRGPSNRRWNGWLSRPTSGSQFLWPHSDHCSIGRKNDTHRETKHRAHSNFV